MDITELQLNSGKEYGVILEGGGAKGAYQVGVWRTLRETGIRIRGAVDTSVGILNGALICMDDFEKVERIWEDINYSRAMDVGDELTKRLRKFSLEDISSPTSPNVGGLVTGAIRALRDGGFDIIPLGALIGDVADEEKVRNSNRGLYVVTYSISDRYPLIANIRETPEGTVAGLLMANAYLIDFRQKQLGGKYYMDGGGINDVPMDALLGKGCKGVTILCTYGYDVNTEKRLEVLGGVNPYRMAPRRDLSGLLEFDRRQMRRNMLLRYFDGKRMLHGLVGCVYHIDTSEDEPYYFDKMMSKIQSPLSYMKSELEAARRVKTGREIQKEAITGYRVYTEQIFPRLAKKLKLKEGWDYKGLYLPILKDLARQHRVSRSEIYTVGEFLRPVHKETGAAALKVITPILDSGTQVQYIMHRDA